MSIITSETSLDINGKSMRLYCASPVHGGPGILVLPAWWGLNAFFRQVCDRLAEQGYTAIAPDYYGGRVGVSIDETKLLQQAVESDFDAMRASIKAAKDHVASLRPGEQIGLVGFSMGTDWAIMTAAGESDVAATVLFYGGWTTDFSHMTSKVLGHYAESDEWVPFDQILGMEESMKRAGVDVTVHRYPKTAHWFMELDRPEYVPAAASLAWERTLLFLDQNLKQARA
jgi:carboxymethylenebutenolidase